MPEPARIPEPSRKQRAGSAGVRLTSRRAEPLAINVKPLFLSVDPVQVFRFLCLGILVLLGLHCATMAVRMAHLGGVGRFVRLFDLDTEANVPTFYAVLQL